MTDEERARDQALHAAIDGVLKDHADHESDRGMLTDYLLVAEQIGDDGEPYLRIISSEATPQWRRLGMIHYAAQVQQAQTVRDEID